MGVMLPAPPTAVPIGSVRFFGAGTLLSKGSTNMAPAIALPEIADNNDINKRGFSKDEVSVFTAITLLNKRQF